MSESNVFKVLIAGDGGVGKTTFLTKYTKGEFVMNTKMTIGLEFFIKEVIYNNYNIIFQIWDLSGQDQFRFLHKDFTAGSRCSLLLFDLTRPSTINNLEEWIKIIRKKSSKLPIILIGSKLDLIDKINVGDDMALKLKKKYKFADYIKISSKTGENIEAVFQLLVKILLE